MDVRILGPLEVRCGGAPIELPRAKHRALLAMLVLHHGRVVSADRLVEALWAGRPPQSAVNTLHGYVSHLRRMLEPCSQGPGGGAGIATRSPGYLLVVDSECVDARRFERLVSDGRRALASSEPRLADELLEQALGLWRGRPYSEVADDPLATAEAARLEELRLVAAEERGEAELTLGHHGQVAARLRAEIDQHPFRERLWGQLMVALYRCGRQAEALRAFQDARRRLVDELGIEPSPALRRIEADILAQAPALDWSQRSTQPRSPNRDTGEDSEPRIPVGVSWSPLAGRLRERDQLISLWKEACAGERQGALVAGEPGIGKTRLVAELASEAQRSGGTVLYGRSDEELQAPFRPFVEAVNRLAPTAAGASSPGLWKGDMRQLVPRFAEYEQTRGDAETERLRLFDGVSGWLQEVSEEAPVLLAVDDLHWADRSSLLLLRHLLTALRPSRLLIVGTYRDADVSWGSPLADLLADLRRLGGVERINLAGLDESETEAFLAERVGRWVDEVEIRELAGPVRALTGGNPFFMGELVSHLLEVGALDGPGKVDVASVASLAVPEGVREVVARRLSSLPAETVSILSSAAVVGAEFDARTLAAVLATDDERVIDALEPALARRLVVEAPTGFGHYRFAHALVRQTLEEEHSKAGRTRLHHRIGQVLEGAGASFTDLASHFGAAAPMAGADKAVRYGRLAAREAAERLALDEAAAFLERTLESERLLPPDPQRRAELLLDLGEAMNACGRVADARRVFLDAAAQARGRGRADLLARAAVGYGGVASVWVQFGEDAGPDLAREALAALPDGDSVQRVLCLAKLSLWLSGDPDPSARLAMTADALAMAQRLGEPAAWVPAISGRLWALRGQPGGPAEQLVLARQQADLAAGLEQPAAAAEALCYRAIASQNLGDLVTAHQAVQELGELGDQTNLSIARWFGATIGATLAIAEGRFDELSELNAREREVAAAVGEIGQLIADGHVQQAALRREAWDEVAAISAQMLERHPLVLAGWGFPVLISWARGDTEAARSALEDWHGQVLPFVPAEFRFLVAGFLARVTAALRAHDVAQVLEGILMPHAGTWCSVGMVDWGMTDHLLGLLHASLDRHQDGRGALRRAINAYRSAGARAWLAVALADLAELADDGDEARAAAAEAIALSHEIGVPNVARRAAAGVSG